MGPQNIIVALLVLSFLNLDAEAMSIEKAIFSSAPVAQMFNFFHLMKEGDVKVMTEYDLLLTLEQHEYLYKGNPSRSRRKAIKDADFRWTGCKVYYEIEDSLNDANSKAVIKQAMEHWEKYTCLEFIESRSKQSRIQFRDATACYSQLGMQKSPQPLGLAAGCRVKGIVVHEIGHAIGFVHEHMRSDRDKFVKINFAAIPERFHSQFEKYNTSYITAYGIPYDYTSLMHYGSSLLPNSIRTLDKSYQDKIGQREGLTFKDIKLANVMYNCARVMGCSSSINCPADGFVFYKNFKNKGKCKCWCDSGNIKDPLVLCSDKTRPVIPPPNPKPPISTNDTDPPMGCMDMHTDCKDFKKRGLCMTEMELMMDVCAKTCDFCDKGKGMCMDHEKACRMTAAAGLCKNPGFKMVMEKLCPDSCGLCAKPPNPCDIQREMMGDLPLQRTGNSAWRTTWSLPVLAALLVELTAGFLWNAKSF